MLIFKQNRACRKMRMNCLGHVWLIKVRLPVANLPVANFHHFSQFKKTFRLRKMFTYLLRLLLGARLA